VLSDASAVVATAAREASAERGDQDDNGHQPAHPTVRLV
jgi:hypothetical protein